VRFAFNRGLAIQSHFYKIKGVSLKPLRTFSIQNLTLDTQDSNPSMASNQAMFLPVRIGLKPPNANLLQQKSIVNYYASILVEDGVEWR